MADAINEATTGKVAIIGIGCRLPGGATDHRGFWRNLVTGKDCLTATPPDRYDAATLASRHRDKPGKLATGRGGYIDGFDEFEPAFFGISPREADHMDPQQRKLLEVAWEALEDAGQRPAGLAGTDTGVYVGAFTLDYKILQFADLSFGTLAAHTATGTMMTMVSNRISHCFDFRGPSLTVDTACSSSLVTVHLACQSLLRGESDLALAGGVLLHSAPQYTIAETKGGFLSPNGRSRAFDASAEGYVRAEGVGLVVLKRLDEALADGDPVHAVVVGSGVNQDGRTNGITVPSAEAQTSLVRRVCAQAGITPGDLQYVEAHGTSTPVGDPIEANALARVLTEGRAPGAACYVGSVKTNIGHTESAAGVAGLIKTALALKHRVIPPHINLDTVNPAIDYEGSPFTIPTRATAWPAHEGPARAGVNSFGFGGTNAHLVLEEPPVRTAAPRRASEPGRAAAPVPEESARPGGPGWSILPLTARHPDALPERAAGIRRELDGGNGARPALADLGHTLAHRRQHLESRLSVVYSTRASLAEALDAHLRGEPHPRVVQGRRLEPEDRRLVWVFTGMGPQWWGMGRGLLESEPVFRKVVTACDREIRRLAGWSLLDELAAGAETSRMAETWLAQPANFAVQAGLAALWRSYGVRPDAVVGHSTGEIAAFHEAGVYSLEEAVGIAVHRSRLQHTLAGSGGMLAVSLGEEEAERRVRPYAGRVCVAAVNSPTSVTLAGDRDTLVRLAEELGAEQVFARLLTVQVPYHSPQMDRIKDELLASLAGLAPRPAQVPVHLTGIEGPADGVALDAAYWWRNVRDRVAFRAAVDRLADEGHRLFLEIGPHPALAHSIRECLEATGRSAVTVPSVRREEDEPERFAASLATLHNLGVDIDWDVLQPAGRTVPLPRYPWRRDRHWTEPENVARVRLGRLDHPLLGRRTDHPAPAWQAELDTERLPYLAGHRIQDSVVFPAAGYLEMATQAVLALTGGSSAVLAGIELRKALFLSEEETRTVHLTLDPESAGFTIASAPAGPGAERAVHATGVVRTAQPLAAGPPLDPAAVQARSRQWLTGSQCYAGLAALGYHYGPAFQALDEVWIGDGEVLARVSPPAGMGDDAARHHLHPVLLDACFQSLLTRQIPPDGVPPAATGIRLPLSLAELSLAPVGDRRLWAHGVITRDDGDELVADLALYAEDGTPLGHLRGFRAADVEKASTSVSRATVDSWLAVPTWTDLPWPGHPENAGSAGSPGEAGTTAGTAGDWLLFTDGGPGGVGAAFAALVAGLGHRCRTVRPGGSYTRDAAGTAFTLAPDSDDHLARLFADLDADGEPFRGTVVHLAGLGLPAYARCGREELRRAADVGAYGLVALARVLQARQQPCALHVVTRGAQPVTPGETVEPLGAPVWGVTRVLRHQELTGHRGKLIDLDPAHDPGGAGARAEAEALLREFRTDDEEEIGLRGARRATSRLRPADGLTHPLPLRLRADGSYLVTGAFGALGRLLCRTLVRRGARHLVLMGRTPLPPRREWRRTDPACAQGRAVALLKELEALGAHAVAAPVDVTDEPALTAWLDAHRQGDPPPLRGVFHLAGQVRDTRIADLDRAAFDAVHDPKAVGAYLLDKHLRDEPLDHFVLFASVASLLTTAGQTNYAAGNAFLDALAHRRRAEGLPALSLDWGPWATGMIEELGLVEHYLHSRGMSSLTPDVGMSVVERVLGQDRAQLVVATVVDWRTFLAWYDAPPALVADLAAAAQAPADSGGGFLDTFRAADGEQRRALVAERFTRLVAAVLRTPVQEIDPAGGLGALGLDSLLAMEVRAKAQAEFGVALPVVALLSGTPVGELADRLHDALAERVADQGGGADTATVELFTDEGDHPLTQNQKALWFLKQLNPEGYAYNIGGAVEVRAALDAELMFEAVRRLIARHPALRTTFHLSDGRPVQRTAAEAEPDLALFDVEGQEWEEIRRTIIREYRARYDLERDALVRFRLFRRGDDRWIIMKAVHHIVSDAVSTFTFIEELLSVYEALKRGGEPSLPPVPARYVDFLNQQNRFLASPEAGAMLDHWRSHLPAEVPLLDLPTDRPRPAVQTHNGASEFFVLDEELSARVHALAQRHGVTPFMVLLSAYYLFLHRYSGQDHVIVGSPVTGRTQQEFASVYGYFVNPLPLHADLSGAPSVAELLDQVRATVLNGLDNQEYPFVLLVEELGLTHDPSRSAVFQAMFILLTHKVATEQYGYRLEYIELPEEEGQFDLTLSVYEDEAEGRFHAVLKYNTDLFDPETVRRMAGHYVHLLDSMTRARPDTPTPALEMVGAEEHEKLVGEWSGAREAAAQQRALGAHRPVHRLIAEAAAARPDAVAVTVPAPHGASARLTYGALDRRADARARRLRQLGVGPGSVVGLRLDKSPDLIITLLAVLKAGGAYLPLDPALPADRTAQVLAGAGAHLLVTGPRTDGTPAMVPCPAVTPGQLRAAESDGPAPDTTDDPDAPAYVIHTSGTTGVPKAVQVSHRNLAAAYEAWRTAYHLERDARVHLQTAQPSFDVFTGDLVRALCSGGTLVLADRDLVFDTARLYRTLRAERVDCAELVPALVRGLMDHCEREGDRLDFLGLLVVGSDTWKVAEYRRLRALCGPGTRVLNSYGVTEATIDSAFFAGPADGLEPGLTVPAGRPLPHATLYILDAYGAPVPPGVTGELWIGGDGVSLGYAGDPELTARRFTTRVLSREPGARPERLYRTGDLARWDAEGRVHLLGRQDGQVKLRGHRIETGEIESHLTGRPGVARAVAAVRADATGEAVLCAYCVPEPGAALDLRSLRRDLAAALPAHMVPAHLAEVAELPLTAHGKVDLRALPEPRGGERHHAYEAPVTLYEISMARHWEALLGLDRAGLGDDFFACGGSSIKLIELLHHLRTEFGVAVPVSRLYQVTTLHGMAAAVEERVTGTTAAELPHLTFNEGVPDPLFCFPPAGGHGLVYRGLAAQLPEYRVVAFNYLPGDDKVARYADLVEAARPEGECRLLGYSLGGNLAFEVARVLEARGRSVGHVLILDSRRVTEVFEPGADGLKAFEAELAGHLHKHTGSQIVTAAVLEHAAEYLSFCGRNPNTGTVSAPVSVLSDEEKTALYAAGVPGAWHGSSTTGTRVLRGSGTHADMLDPEHLSRNADLVRALLTGEAGRAA
ncbi:amino acid adenylation domain-containing protein [Streptomyces rutgersensis]|uniref:Amino acid adenylation domain-containing protein n=1 Tax=Streptomyces rutgersensis TaxID=53451 RepID=A0ABX6RV64_9ACTN|nr:non-ribosomal peptide synthetase/type I polyketide synthase [Streptomyces rutgersensis]QNE84165.1 amino acid adenylation domain-containing protein [Streptomyces rutgersensis]